MTSITTVRTSARLLAFESRLAEPQGFGCCCDCRADDVKLVMDPDPELYPDAYCEHCTRLRMDRLRAFLLSGGKWGRA